MFFYVKKSTCEWVSSQRRRTERPLKVFSICCTQRADVSYKSGVILTSAKLNIFSILFSIKNQKIMMFKPPVHLVITENTFKKYWHSCLLLKTPSKSVFSNNQLYQYFMERTGVLAHHWILMEISTLKIFGPETSVFR